MVGPRTPFGKVIRSNAPVGFKGPNGMASVTKYDLEQLEIYGVPTDGRPLWSGERAHDLVANP